MANRFFLQIQIKGASGETLPLVRHFRFKVWVEGTPCAAILRQPTRGLWLSLYCYKGSHFGFLGEQWRKLSHGRKFWRRSSLISNREVYRNCLLSIIMEHCNEVARGWEWVSLQLGVSYWGTLNGKSTFTHVQRQRTNLTNIFPSYLLSCCGKMDLSRNDVLSQMTAVLDVTAPFEQCIVRSFWRCTSGCGRASS